MKHYLVRRENGFWYVLSKEGAKPVALVSTKSKSKNDAQEFLKTYLPGKKVENIPTLSVLKDVLDEKLTGVLSKKTIITYKGELKHLIDSVGDKRLDELEQSDAVKWSLDLIKRWAPKTYNTGLRSLRAVFNRCKKWYPEIAQQCGAFDNLELLRLPEKEALFLTEKDFKKFLEAEQSELYKRLFAFAFYTGMRKGEIRHTKWEHVNFEKNQIAVLNTEDFQTKSLRNRHIPIANSLKPILIEMQKERDNGYLFSRHEGKKLSDGNVSYSFQRTLAKTT
jgi:integrase